MVDVETASPFYPALDGLPLSLGSIWYGVAGQNPVTNPVTVYWDAAGTQPAAQPISVMNGVPTRNGTPAQIYISGDYSKLVQDSMGRQVLYQPAQSGRALDTITFTQSGTGAVPRSAQDKMREVVSITDFGAVSGDTGDQSATIQLALNTGKAVYIPYGTYRFASTLTLPAGTYLLGPGKLHYTGTDTAIRPRGNDVKLEGFTLYGDAGGTYIATHVGISVQETVITPLSVTWVDNLKIRGVEVYGFGADGINLNWVRDLEISGCRIHDVGVHGILTLSAIRAVITGNRIDNITPGGPGGIGYGIALSRQFTLSVANAPASQNITVSDNVITNILNYTALDAHGGNNITFSGNTTDNCTVAVDLSHSTGGGDQVTCTNITITGNTFRGVSSPNYRAPGVLLNAQSGAGEIARGITITGNTFVAHGFEASSPYFPITGGAVFITYAEGVTVSGNSFYACVGRCVAVSTLGRGVSITGNTVSNLAISGSTQEAFSLVDTSGRGTIDGNMMTGTGVLCNSTTTDAGYGLKLGANNMIDGGCTMTTANTKSRLAGGTYLTAPRVMVAWDQTGTLAWYVFENTNYTSASFTITKNGTGDFTVAWPSGIFDNAIVAPVYSGKQPNAGQVKTDVVTTDNATSAQCKSYDTSGAAVDCTENVLMVWGR